MRSGRRVGPLPCRSRAPVLARHLARVRAYADGESEPSPLLYQRALRDVIGHCLYGVDVNPMAAELCRVGLWLEALEPGKPLSFLDRHIRVGNSLLGATPELIEAGLPDAAFKPIEGDDKKTCSQLRKRNKTERAHGQRDLGLVAESEEEYDSLATRSRSIDHAPDGTLEDIHTEGRSVPSHAGVCGLPARATARGCLVRRLRLAKAVWCSRCTDHGHDSPHS